MQIDDGNKHILINFTKLECVPEKKTKGCTSKNKVVWNFELLLIQNVVS